MILKTGNRASTEVFFSLVLVFTLFLAGCGEQLSKEEYLQKAREAASGGDTRSAIINLKNALQIAPEFVEARLELGERYNEMGAGAAAEKEFSAALSLAGPSKEGAMGLIRAQMLQRKYDEALEAVSRFDGELGPVARAYLEGYALFGKRDIAAAEEGFRQALELDPGNVEARRGLARVAWSTGEKDLARERLEEIVRDAPDDFQARVLLGELQLDLSDPEAALEQFRAADRLYPFNYAGKLGMAKSLVLLERPDEVLRQTSRLKRNPDFNVVATFLEALAFYQKEDLTDALASLNDVLTARPNYGQAMLLAAHIHAQEGNSEQAMELARTYLTRSPGDNVARRMLALLELRLGSAENALRVLNAAPPSAMGDPELLETLAAIHLFLGNHDDALRYREQAVALSEQAIPQRTRLAMTRLLVGEVEAAVKDLNTVLQEEADNAAAKQALIHSYLVKGDLKQAEAVARQLVAEKPDLAVAHNYLGLIELRRENLDAARDHFLEAERLEAGNIEAGLNLATIDIKADRRRRAGERYEELSRKHANNPRVLTAYARYQAGQGNNKAAFELLQRAVARNPGAVEPRVILAEFYRRVGRVDEALTLARQAADINPSKLEVLKVLVETLIEKGEFETALAKAETLVELYPQDVDGRLLLAVVAEEMGKTPIQRSQLEAVLRHEPDNLRASLLLARRELADDDTAAARRRAEQLRREHPEATAVSELLVRALLADGALDRALAEADGLVERYPDAPRPLELLGLVYKARGETAKAIDALEKALAVTANDPGILAELYDLDESRRDEYGRRLAEQAAGPGLGEKALKALADYFQARQQPEKAARFLERVRALDRTDIDSRATLTRIYLFNGEKEKAAEVLEEALAIAPESEDVLLLRGVVKRQEGDYAAAAESDRAVIARYPDSERAFYGLALSLNALGDQEGVIDALGRVTELNPQNTLARVMLAETLIEAGALGRAEKLVQQLKRSHPELSSAHGLAGDLAMAKGDFGGAVEAYEKALGLSDSVAVLQKVARALSERHGPQASIGRLKEWMAEHPDEPAAREALGDYLVAAGSIDEALEQYKAVDEKQPRRALLLNKIAWLLQERDDPSAERYADRAHRLAPDNGAILDTYGWILVKAGNVEKGLSLLYRAAERLPDEPTVAYHLARALRDTGRNQEAFRVLSPIMESGVEFPEREQARFLLKRLQ